MSIDEDLRAAMDDFAAGTEPLQPAEVLRRGKRYRAQRRLFAAVCTSAAVLAVTTVVVVVPWNENGNGNGAATSPAPVVSSTSPSAPTPDERFDFGTPTEEEAGVFSAAIVDKSLPPDIGDAAVSFKWIPGDTKLQPHDPDGDAVEDITVGDIKVRVDKYKTDAGYDRQMYWVANGTKYVLLANDIRGDDDKAYAPSDADLAWLVQRITTRFKGRP